VLLSKYKENGMNEQQKAATEFLFSFFEEMEAWEIALADRYSAIDWENTTEELVKQIFDDGRSRLEAIFREYCEVGPEAERLQDEQPSFRVGEPTYSRECERVVSCRQQNHTIIIETQQVKPPNWEYRYELVPREGEWRICDKRDRRTPKHRTWEADIL
jgi:hypothetical protein